MQLFPRLSEPDDAPALRVGDAELSYSELAAAAAGFAERVGQARRVAIWATPSVETCVGVLGALAAGAAVVPINAGAGARELEHILGDSEPGLVVAPAGAELPAALERLPRAELDTGPPGARLPDALGDEDPAFVLYTSGTTGPPKGAVIPRRAVVSNLDALTEVWAWTADDRLAHALPLFHVHGLVLGVLGPLRPRRVRRARGALLTGCDSRRAGARGDDGLRRADDVPPHRPRGRRGRVAGAGVSAVCECSSRAPRRCPRSCTSASRS